MSWQRKLGKWGFNNKGKSTCKKKIKSCQLILDSNKLRDKIEVLNAAKDIAID